MGVIDTLLEKRENKGRLEGKKEGRLEGKIEGRLEGMQIIKTDVIKKMCNQKINPEIIQSIVSMPLQDVISIINDYKKSK